MPFKKDNFIDEVLGIEIGLGLHVYGLDTAER